MTKYRKKPVVIEARKFPEEKNENVNELSEASHGGSATRGLRVKR